MLEGTRVSAWHKGPRHGSHSVGINHMRPMTFGIDSIRPKGAPTTTTLVGLGPTVMDLSRVLPPVVVLKTGIILVILRRIDTFPIKCSPRIKTGASSSIVPATRAIFVVIFVVVDGVMVVTRGTPVSSSWRVGCWYDIIAVSGFIFIGCRWNGCVVVLGLCGWLVLKKRMNSI